jgi:hypothetical protein
MARAGYEILQMDEAYTDFVARYPGYVKTA